MGGEVVAIVLTGAGVLVGVWRLVESVRRDLAGALHREIGTVRDDIRALNGRIDAVNGRIDNILLAGRATAREEG